MRRIWVVVLCLVIFIASFYLAWNRYEVRFAGSTLVHTNLKTYVSSSYGYSLQYPSSWGATTTLGNGIVLFSNPEYLKERLKNPETFDRQDYASINTSVYDYGVQTAGGVVSAQTDILAFAKNMYSNIVPPGKNIVVGGRQAMEFYRMNLSLRPQYAQNCPLADQSECYTQNGMTKQVWVKLPKGLLLVEDSYGRTFEDKSYADRVFRQIISSLDFQ